MAVTDKDGRNISGNAAKLDRYETRRAIAERIADAVLDSTGYFWNSVEFLLLNKFPLENLMPSLIIDFVSVPESGHIVIFRDA